MCAAPRRRPSRSPAAARARRAGAWPGCSGASSGHQVTTGTSGTSSGATTESACCPSGPYMRSTIVSPGEASPTRISASSRESALGLRVMTARTRHGCSRAAWLAARIASYCAASSVTMMSVSTMPSVMPPSRRRASVSAVSMAPVVVSVRSIVIGVSLLSLTAEPTAGARRGRRAPSSRRRTRARPSPTRTGPAWCSRPRTARSGRGCARRARPPPAGGTAAGRR